MRVHLHIILFSSFYYSTITNIYIYNKRKELQEINLVTHLQTTFLYPSLFVFSLYIYLYM